MLPQLWIYNGKLSPSEEQGIRVPVCHKFELDKAEQGAFQSVHSSCTTPGPSSSPLSLSHSFTHTMNINFDEYNLSEFIQRAYNILQVGDEDYESKMAFSRFTLTGKRSFHDGRQTQASILMMSYRYPMQELDPVVRRDIDSIIGFTRNIPIRCSLYVFPIPPHQYTLRSSLKILVPFLINGRVRAFC